jgi:L-histidine Nalpha-methyltransferase
VSGREAIAPVIEVHLGPDDLRRTMEGDVVDGLTAARKTLPPKYFYDDAGSELFDKITRLAEYYPTEAERTILREEGPAIVAAARADTLVELGSGTSDKTRVLLDAMAARGTLRRYVPFDVSEATLRDASDRIAARYPGVEVHGVVGDFDHHLDLVPSGGGRMVAFLGGTIGNFEPVERAEFLHDVAATLGPDDSFLLGTDLVKEPARLVRAYDDDAGVTAAFNLNVLRVLNASLGADFEPDQFEHRAVWDPDAEWIEMRLRSSVDQHVRIEAVDLDVDFAEGEEVRTEISAKFRREGVERELAAAGLDLVGWWTDPPGDFALSLSRPGPLPASLR